MESVEDIEQRIERARRTFAELKAEMARAIVGHEALIEQVFIALVCGGHCLLEGVPGIGQDADGAQPRRDPAASASRASSSRRT